MYPGKSGGIRRFIYGLGKKVIISNTLAKCVDTIYGLEYTELTGFLAWFAAILYTLQIYYDFSGYSDIAGGTAKLLGINLKINFKSPYFSQSIKEFWSRWHISLSAWFRDYIYIPLGGNRVSRIRHSFNLLITFLASGLWHGANWTFIAWGGTWRCSGYRTYFIT